MAAGSGPYGDRTLAVIGYRAYWIRQIAKRYNEQGPEAMRNRRHTTSYRPAPVCPESGRPARCILGRPPSTSTGREPMLPAWISQDWAERFLQPGWSYLVKLKHSRQVPRPQHALADPKEQVEFKKSYVLADSTAHEQGYTEQGGPHTGRDC